MKIGLLNFAEALLTVGLLVIPLHVVVAQQGDGGSRSTASDAAMPTSPSVRACLETIEMGDRSTANDDYSFSNDDRRQSLQWLKQQAGAQLDEENKRRPVALSLDQEIRENRVGDAAVRAGEIVRERQPRPDDDGLPGPGPKTPLAAQPSINPGRRELLPTPGQATSDDRGASAQSGSTGRTGDQPSKPDKYDIKAYDVWRKKVGWTQYEPVVVIGSRSHVRNLLIVIWTHAAKDSPLSILRGLSADINSKNLSIMLYQVAGPDKTELENGALFLCVPRDQYPLFMIAYFDRRDHSTEHRYDSQQTIAEIGRSFGLPSDPNACHAGASGFQRTTALTNYRNGLIKAYHPDSLPAYILNGKSLAPRNANDIRKSLIER